jgi:hypothetical protein
MCAGVHVHRMQQLRRSQEPKGCAGPALEAAGLCLVLTFADTMMMGRDTEGYLCLMTWHTSYPLMSGILHSQLAQAAQQRAVS